MVQLSEWQTLLAVEAGAAATLTGLVFIAVSLNLSRILTIAGLTGRAGESLVQFLQIFFVASFALIPGQRAPMLGIEILVVSLFSWAVQITGQIRYARSRSGHPRSWLVIRVVMSQFATLPFCIAGVLLLLGNAAGMYWLVPGFVFSFAAGVVSAWVLLVEILR